MYTDISMIAVVETLGFFDDFGSSLFSFTFQPCFLAMRVYVKVVDHHPQKGAQFRL